MSIRPLLKQPSRPKENRSGSEPVAITVLRRPGVICGQAMAHGNCGRKNLPKSVRIAWNLSQGERMFGNMEPMQIPRSSAGNQMKSVARRINESYAEFVDLLAEADVAQEWLADGSPDVTQWLNARFGISPKLGRRLHQVSKRVQDLPELRNRFASGELSLDLVDLISEVATPETELDLLDATDGLDLHDVARHVSRAKSPTSEEARRERETEWLSTQWNLKRTRMKLGGELGRAHGQIVEDRLVETSKEMPKNIETGKYDDWSKRMADALVETCATDSDGRAPVPTMVIHADVSVFEGDIGIEIAELGRGPVISRELAEMLGCDASTEIVVSDRSAIVGIGRKSRKVPGWLRRQVEYRDHHCQAPGCGRTAFLQIHHLQGWRLGGKTDLDNLVLLCWWHHLFIHENGWHITRDPHGRFVFRKSDWTPYPPRSS